MAEDSNLEDILEIEEIVNFEVSIQGKIIPDRDNPLDCLGSEEIRKRYGGYQSRGNTTCIFFETLLV